MTRGLGYTPDPEDAKVEDWPFKALRATGTLYKSLGAWAVRLEREGDLRPWVVDVLDQGPIGSCVVNAGFQAVRMVHRRDRGGAPPLGARLPGYYLLRAYIDTTGWDSGGHIRDFFRGINERGFGNEADYPYVPEQYLLKPPPEWDTDSFDQRGNAVGSPARYWRVLTLAEMRDALDHGLPVVIGAMVSDEFVNFDGKKVFDPPLPNEVVGGHAMCLVGHDLPDVGAGTFTAVGSWGRGAHDNGFHHFSDAYADRFIDMWAVERAPFFAEAA